MRLKAERRQSRRRGATPILSFPHKGGKGRQRRQSAPFTDQARKGECARPFLPRGRPQAALQIAMTVGRNRSTGSCHDKSQRRLTKNPPMRASKIIHIVSAHAEGEVGDVIVGGVAPPPGETLWEQSRFIARDGALREFRAQRAARRGVSPRQSARAPKDLGRRWASSSWSPRTRRRCRAPMRSASRPCCSTPASCRCKSLRRISRSRRPGGLIAVVAECRDGKPSESASRTCPPSPTGSTRRSKSIGTGDAQRRHRLWRRQLRHRRRGGARLCHRA